MVSSKLKMTMIFSGILLLGLLVSGFWLRAILLENSDAKLLIADSEQLQVIKGAVNDEYNRCAGFLLQDSGDFAQFEYCKQYITWVDKTF